MSSLKKFLDSNSVQNGDIITISDEGGVRLSGRIDMPVGVFMSSQNDGFVSSTVNVITDGIVNVEDTNGDIRPINLSNINVNNISKDGRYIVGIDRGKDVNIDTIRQETNREIIIK